MARPMAVGLHSKPLSPAQLGNPKNDMRVTNNCLSVTLRVPRAGIEPARPFRAKGFSYHCGFRHQASLSANLFGVWTIPSPSDRVH